MKPEWSRRRAPQLVPRTRSSHHNCRESDCELRVQSGTGIIELLVSSIPKFASARAASSGELRNRDTRRAVASLPGAELDWQPECCCRARGRQDNLYPTNVKAAAPRSSHGAACTYGRFAPPAELARKANARDEPWPVVSHLADRRRRSRGSRDHRPTRGRPETRRGVSRLRRLCRDGGGAAGRVRDGGRRRAVRKAAA